MDINAIKESYLFKSSKAIGEDSVVVIIVEVSSLIEL